MGLAPREPPHRLGTSDALDQNHVGPHSHPHRRRWGRWQALGAWALLVRRGPSEAHQPREAARTQPPDTPQYGQGRLPLRLLEPHGRARRGGLAPTPARLPSGMGGLRGLEQGGIAPHLSRPGRSPPPPSSGLLRGARASTSTPRRAPASRGGGAGWAGRPRRAQRGPRGRRRPASGPHATAPRGAATAATRRLAHTLRGPRRLALGHWQTAGEAAGPVAS